MLKEYDNVKKEIKNSNSIKWIFIALTVYYLQKIKNLDKTRNRWKNQSLSRCIDCGFKTIAAIDEEELSDLIKVLI